jgi:hypothetical protein
MPVFDFQSKIGSEMKILPVPEQVNAKRQTMALFPNEWRIQGVQDKRVELRNFQTGHTIILPDSYIRNADQQKLELRFKIVVKGKRTSF